MNQSCTTPSENIANDWHVQPPTKRTAAGCLVGGLSSQPSSYSVDSRKECSATEIASPKSNNVENISRIELEEPSFPVLCAGSAQLRGAAARGIHFCITSALTMYMFH
ncbi:unnamed protein product [Phytophthora lilii]|uniref:Unnamed protein product n=1 Tax=Phytophthora lilii TaxID=2077276 RepID=A0A9W6XBN8_9STRA|nr:unnamed protein product [Phytophthora lilii]